MYDWPDEIALNDVYEIVGVLSLEFEAEEDLDLNKDVPDSLP